MPNGIRLISGRDMITGTSPTGLVRFKCIAYSNENSGGFSGEYGSDLVTAAASCGSIVIPGGQTGVKYYLDLDAHMPPCWDGVNLDSANHRSHMADTLKVNGVGEFCPKTHPNLIPTYEAQVLYPIDSTLNQTGTWAANQQTWYLSSDRMPGMAIMRPGTTFHFDILDAGNQAIKKIWTDNCIDLMLNCSAGVLGDGTGLTPDPNIIQTQHAKTPRPKMTMEAAHGTIHGPM
ncbi:DUF1996 domain-containing protein [Sphingomonas endolithica]|uniref:DUF1996 domain-containing protein n=1 Tax=Sphingomonas endolithica TaxID=2972485 RepID=UPI0021AE7DC7|nr:DUF1996 domain-containing protein [Sphingomonas sp. ZFBP2030]